MIGFYITRRSGEKKKQEASEVRYIQMMIMELHKKVKVIWKSK